MLVLSRKKSERIIAGPVVITVVEIRGNSVRLGLTAAADVPIDREELLLKKAAGSLQYSEVELQLPAAADAA